MESDIEEIKRRAVGIILSLLEGKPCQELSLLKKLLRRKDCSPGVKDKTIALGIIHSVSKVRGRLPLAVLRSDMAKSRGTSAPTLYRWIDDLIGAGLIKRDIEGRRVFLSLDGALAQIRDHIFTYSPGARLDWMELLAIASHYGIKDIDYASPVFSGACHLPDDGPRLERSEEGQKVFYTRKG